MDQTNGAVRPSRLKASDVRRATPVRLLGGDARLASNDESTPRACSTCEQLHSNTCRLPLSDMDCGADRPQWKAAGWVLLARAMAPHLQA